MATAPEPKASGPSSILIKSAERHARTGEIAEAVRAYIAAGKAFLNDESDVARAREAFSAASSIDPENLEAIFELGHADAIEGKLREALAKFVTVTRKSNATHVPALFEAACIYQELGMYDQAILAFRKVLDRDRTNVQAIVNVARRLQAMGMRPEAMVHFLRAAETAFEAHQFGTCRQLLNLILAMDPLNAKVRTMLADLNDLKIAEAPDVAPPATPAAPNTIETNKASDEPAPSLRRPEEDEVDALRAHRDILAQERERLARDIEALGRAKVSEEIELATLRARRDSATTELTELFKKVDSVKAQKKVAPAKPKAAASKTATAAAKTPPKVAGPVVAAGPPKAADPVVAAALQKTARARPRIEPDKPALPKKSKTRSDRTPE